MNKKGTMVYRLGDLFDLHMGKTPSRNNTAYWETKDNKWISIADLTKAGKYISETKEYLSNSAVANSGIVPIPAGTIIMSFKLSIGKTAITSEEMYSNEAIMAFHDRHLVELCADYIYYLLCAQDWNKGANKAVMGMTQNKATLSSREVLIHPLEQQLEIIAKLDKISRLIDRRKQQLEKLDELVKARFVEMFGDATALKKEPLKQNIEEMFIGPFGSSLKNESFVSKETGYCMVYEQKHAIKGTMDVATRYIDNSKYQELKRFTVTGGDIIVSCRGTIGKTFIVPEEAPLGVMHPSIMKIRVKREIYDIVFFNHLLSTVLEKHEDEANGSGVKMAITATNLGEEFFIVPPIEAQHQFAAFVEQIDKIKSTIQKSLDELRTLFDSLMQEYFG